MTVVGRQAVPMSIDRDDFDVPVEDFDFNQISGVSSLIDLMANAGGFTATKLEHARDVLRASIDKSLSLIHI